MTLGDPTDLGGDGIADGGDGPVPAPGKYTIVIGADDINLAGVTKLSEVDPTGVLGSGNFVIEIITDFGTTQFAGSIFPGTFAFNGQPITITGAETFVDITVTSADFDSEIALFRGTRRNDTTNVDADIDGTIVADFDFFPFPGATYTFDLITSDEEITGDPTFEVRDLPPDFTVDFFGITETEDDGTQSIRIVVSSDIDCPGDANGDSRVGFIDLFIVLANYGRPSNAGPIGGDVNNNGFVSADDLFFVLANFGDVCM